jgi:hypothetical protein
LLRMLGCGSPCPLRTIASLPFIYQMNVLYYEYEFGAWRF